MSRFVNCMILRKSQRLLRIEASLRFFLRRALSVGH